MACPQLSLDILAAVLTKLSLVDLNLWAQSTRGNYLLVRNELRGRHRRMLQSFVPNPDALLQQLRLHEGIISGSFALNYFEGNNSWAAADLDVYIPHDAWLSMCTYMVDVEGYATDPEVELRIARVQARIKEKQSQMLHVVPTNDTVHSEDDTDDEDDEDDIDWIYSPLFVETGISAVRRLFKRGQKVDIIQVKSTCASFALTRFWSTLQMNYLTPDGFCCAYPEYTLNGMGVLNPLAVNRHGIARSTVRHLIDKYIARGYAFVPRALADGQSCAHDTIGCPLLRRGFDDAYCYSMWFDTTDTAFSFSGAILPSQVHKVGWRLGGKHGDDLFEKPTARVFDAVTGNLESKKLYGRFD